ncbi:CLUMA_CG018733, isoform A [Clunio marinus]|uniref:Tetraspanin n=1 Tax=Clunio marinus TaxID=568069 RepID=A0A1J1IZR8_9DIPT|nr:CLUMA_CG018733, isoform A [Clunio marinus]
MSHKCAKGIIKYFLFILNLLCAIVGIVLIVHGGLALAKVTDLKNVLPTDYLSDLIPTIVIFLGVFIFFISFLGCCGAIQSHVCLLETYSICLLLLVMFQVMLACFIFLFVDDVQKESVRSFSRMWRSRGTSRDSRVMVDMIQENLECCGSNSFLNYSLDKIPKSCCKRGVDFCTREQTFYVGCKMQLEDSIKSSAQTISYLCLGAGIIELLGAIMGFILSGYIRKVQAIRRCCFG